MSPHERAYGLRGNRNPIQERAGLQPAGLKRVQTHSPAGGDPRAPASLCHGSSPLREVNHPSEMTPLHVPKQEGMAWRGKCHPEGAGMPVGHVFACQAAMPGIPTVWGLTQLCSAPELSLGTPRRALLMSSLRMEADLTSVVLSQESPP